MKIRKNNKGFTLLEIIIVVAIISVLAVILLPRLARVRQPANDAQRINDLRTIQGFLELYYQKYRFYPASMTVGFGSSGGANCGATTLCGILITDSITNSVPGDPVAGSVYEYGSDTAPAQAYVIATTLQSDNNPSLEGDVDGTSYSSIDCTDANKKYCIQF